MNSSFLLAVEKKQDAEHGERGMNIAIQLPHKLQHTLMRETAAHFLLLMDIATFFNLVADFVEGRLLLTFFSPIHFFVVVENPSRLWQFMMSVLVL